MQEFTPTPEPTWTLTPTMTLTPTTTPTPTPNIYIEVTTEAEWQPARIAREATVEGVATNIILLSILISQWVMFLLNRIRPRGGK